MGKLEGLYCIHASYAAVLIHLTAESKHTDALRLSNKQEKIGSKL